MPATSGDVPDEQETRLVIFSPEYPHIGRSKDTQALTFAQTILKNRGSSPRKYPNTLAFLAPDQTRLTELQQAIRFYLAWRSIAEEAEELNLDAFQRNQAIRKRDESNRTVDSRMPETFSWILVPEQPHHSVNEVEWDELRASGEDGLASRASRRLKNDELLLTELGPLRLRHELDRIPLWQGDHVSIKHLCELFATYLYLPRLRDSQVLTRSITEGIAILTWNPDTFAYAGAWDERSGRYQQLVAGQHTIVVSDGSSLLVKPEAAQRQLERDAEEPRKQEAGAGEYGTKPGGGDPATGSIENGKGAYTTGGGSTGTIEPGETEHEERVIRRFYGTAEIDPLSVATTADQLAREIIQHLEALPSSDVQITLEIHADVPEGVPDHVRRIVEENSRSLRLKEFEFEEE